MNAICHGALKITENVLDQNHGRIHNNSEIYGPQ